ncbi:MAG TPA: aminotransferase class I/II-fold pyridoxal phosphate-dependent enzyme [Gemmatimonadaceae bacterium]
MSTVMHPADAADPQSREAPPAPRVATMAAGLVGSEILKIAADVRTLRASGATVCDLTVGDFAPAQFRIPAFLEERIIEALRRGETNYPPSAGLTSLREAVVAFYARTLGLRVTTDSVVITAGSRPGIYATYLTLCDPGDRVVYPVPSWNNNHYCHLVGVVGVPVPCGAEDGFLPTRALLEEPLRGARLLALNSPLNPTGTAFTAEALGEICDLVLEENARREETGERPLYVLYDHVYWMLTFGGTRHVDPVSLRPAMAEYTIFVDGISKNFAATGVRVGWVVGPADVVRRMSSVLGHVGAWAPRAEQAATAELLAAPEEIETYHESLTGGVQRRLQALADGLEAMRADGLAVESIEPMGAIYLSAHFPIAGMRRADGSPIADDEAARRWLLEEARVAVVPFRAFGAREEAGWFRMSVGATSPEEIAEMLPRLRRALEGLRG